MSRSGFRYLYGPVPSRRLGRSLGVDLVPFKTCSYDCVYCQLGRTTNKTIEREAYVPLDEILHELEEKLAVDPDADFIGIAGSGEPTLHSRLGELITAIKGMTHTPVAVLTNGSLLWKSEVRDAIMEADLVLPSLDAGDERLFQSVNRPHPGISFTVMIEGMIEFAAQFRGEIWLEVFLLRGQNAIPPEIKKIAEIAKRIAPARVQLNTIHRPPVERFALPVRKPTLLDMETFFSTRVEIISQSEPVAASHSFPANAQEQELLALISRRPCSVEDVARGIGIHINEALKGLERLRAAGKARVLVSGEKTFYAATIE
jgi:wyosine [tRNA(Phe)-imidazoG37] synthetase (radical SAM superfamily)